MSYKFKDLLRQKFGNLSVIEITNMRQASNIIWKCKCDCGNEHFVPGTDLTRGKVKSCGCFRKRVAKEKVIKDIGEASFNHLYNVYKGNAKKRNLSFKLIKDEFKNLISRNCYYCGAEPNKTHLQNKYANGYYTYNGIDRVDNSKGYILNNCVTCCWECNKRKNSSNSDEFIKWIKKVYSNLFSTERTS